MGEDDLVELLWKSGQVVRSSQSQRPSSDKSSPPPPPPLILRGSGSGGGEENAPLPLPHVQPQPQPPAPMHHESLYIQEEDLVELLWKSGQVVQSSQTQRPSSHEFSPLPPPILRGSGSRGEEENAPLPLPLPHLQLPAPMHYQNPFIQEDEMAYWLHHSYGQEYYCTQVLYPTPVSHPQSSVSLAPSPSSLYIQPVARPTSQILAVGRTEGHLNFSWLSGYISTGRRDEVRQSIPVVRESTQVSSSGTPSSTERTESRVSRTFSDSGLGRKGKAVAIEAARTPSSGVCKVETEPTQLQPARGFAEDKKQKGREETIIRIQGTEEGQGSTSRKRSRAAEMHNLYERRRREKINEKMKALQQLIPRCRKSNKAAMLEDAIDYVKWLQSQIQMISMGHQMMYARNMQQFMSQRPMGMMDINLPPFLPFPGTYFSRPTHMWPLGPPYPAMLYPFIPNTQTSDPSRVHLPAPQPNPVSNQLQLPAYMNPYSHMFGLHQMQQPPPPLQTQTTTTLSTSQASSSMEHEDPDNQPTRE